MIENPLKEVLVKKADLFDMFARTPLGSTTVQSPIIKRDFYNAPNFTETLQNQINPIEARSFRDGAELIEYLLKDPDSIRYLDDVQDLLGKDAKLQEVLKTERSLNDFARNRILYRYGLQNYSADQLAKLDQNAKDRLEQETQRYVELVKNKLTPSLRSSLDKAHKNSQVPTQNPLGKEITSDLDLNGESSNADDFANAVNSSLGELGQYGNEESTDVPINLADFAGTPSVNEALAVAAKGVSGKPTAPTPATAPAPAPAQSAAQVQAPAPASEPKKTKTPAGLTRDETMQFLRQGYVPNSAGGFMLNEDAAANALRRMEADPNLNLGSSITDASRLSRIRNNMLGNQEYTAQGRQQSADDMLYSQAMYHKQRQDALAAENNAALEQYRGQLTNDARADYLRRGEADYRRSLLDGSPLTPAAQWYQTYSNAEIDGNPLPDLPAEVQNGIEQGVHKFRNQFAAQQAPAAPASIKPRNPNYITQQEMDAYASAYAANNSGQQALNTVNKVWGPERLEAAQKRYNNAISGNNKLVNPVTGGQPTQTNTPTPASTSTTAAASTSTPAPGANTGAAAGTSLKKTAGLSKLLINPFLR